MGRQHTRVNPVAFGLMGAIIGGLQLRLSLETKRLLDEADIAKAERLAQIQQGMQLDAEQREDARWEVRNEIEHGQLLERQQFENEAIQGRQSTAQQFQSRQAAEQRAHEAQMEDRRSANDSILEDQRTNNNIRQGRYATIFNTEYERRRGGQDAGAGKGILGDDGRTYAYGEALPPGVKPAGGYGISWAPSASKGGVGDGQNYVSPRSGRPAVPGPASAPAPQMDAPGSSAANPIPVRSREEALSQRGKWVRAPNGTVNFVY